jgi:hypothetical protein
MLIADRNGMVSVTKSTPTARDYVQNGLVAMWDGIENAGWGVHDAAATTWVDLTGGGANWLLKDSNTTQVFEVGSDYVKILSGVSYNGRGHCTPSWSADGDIKQMEIVLDNTDFSVTATSRICALGVSNGNNNSQMAIRDGNLFQFQYNKYPLLQLRTGLNAISFDGDTARGLFNGALTDSAKTIVGSGYVYSPPVLGAYAAQAAIGIKIKALRIYSRVLTEAEMLANDAIDKARFNLP